MSTALAALGACVASAWAVLLVLLAAGLLSRRTKPGGSLLAYVLGVLIGIDVTANAILGGRPYSTISCRIGESLAAGGWAARVHWPAWFVAHCAASIFPAIV